MEENEKEQKREGKKKTRTNEKGERGMHKKMKIET
jgi:hypothetical protein